LLVEDALVTGREAGTEATGKGLPVVAAQTVVEGAAGEVPAKSTEAQKY
jgi:hypothetical protein